MAKDNSILVVDDSAVDLEIISMVCASLHCVVDLATDGPAALNLYQSKRHSIVITDYIMEPMDGLSLIKAIKEINANAICVMITGYPSQEVRNFALEHGFFELITKPIQVKGLMETLKVALNQHRGATEQVGEVAFRNRMDQCLALLGESSLIRDVRSRLFELLTLKEPILIEGREGIGKPCIARVLHENGPFGNSELVECFCAAADEATLSHELIGFEGERGRLLLKAYHGTLIIHNIEALSMNLQKVLARELSSINADIHLIFLVNVRLEDELMKGNIDTQLYFEIAMNELYIPALAERSEDLVCVVRYICDEIDAYEIQRPLSEDEIVELSAELVQEELPGNIDQVVQRVRQHARTSSLAR